MKTFPDTECSICYDCKTCTELECGHFICFACGQRWFETKDTCPFCRLELTPEILAEDFNKPSGVVVVPPENIQMERPYICIFDTVTNETILIPLDQIPDDLQFLMEFTGILSESEIFPNF